MSSLQLFWFILIGVLFAGFFFLEGFDFGVGMSVKTLAKN
ncbi:cytochrome d ubiquinol oxidase subunit II [Tetragenococcus muriaticus PMC-11-5]|nr:cytochrome d ubiquinol oxidase subunit II [Tetragenococcus muriaticus PMC-11-5]